MPLGRPIDGVRACWLAPPSSQCWPGPPRQSPTTACWSPLAGSTPPTLPFAAVGVANFAFAVPGAPQGSARSTCPVKSLLVDSFGAEPSLAAAYVVVLHLAVLAPVPIFWLLLAARRRWQAVAGTDRARTAAVSTETGISSQHVTRTPDDHAPQPSQQAAPQRAFPTGFLWGSATAAHQVEGNNTNNDWWAAEQAGRLPFRSGLACDQYNRFDDDFKLFAELGQTAHRLSIEWSRIEPRPGELSHEALDHYRKVLESLRAHGIEPIVTLHHFSNPIWLTEQGGWTRREVVGRFARYARRVVHEYKDLVRYWVTINEPGVYASQGWLLGVWPPNGSTTCAAPSRSCATWRWGMAGPITR